MTCSLDQRYIPLRLTAQCIRLHHILISLITHLQQTDENCFASPGVYSRRKEFSPQGKLSGHWSLPHDLYPCFFSTYACTVVAKLSDIICLLNFLKPAHSIAFVFLSLIFTTDIIIGILVRVILSSSSHFLAAPSALGPFCWPLGR